MAKKIFQSHSNITRNLTKQKRGNIPPPVVGYGCSSTIGVTKLTMRTLLPNFDKIKIFRNPHDFSRFQDRSTAHRLTNGNCLGAYELCFQMGFSIFQKHGNDLLKIFM